MRGFLKSKPKFDEAEWALAQSRTVARLAGLFSEAALDGIEPEAASDETEPEAVAESLPEVPIELGSAAGLDASATPEYPLVVRPPIIVAGDPRAAAAEPVGSEPVGVMAPPNERFDANGWELPAQAVAPASRSRVAKTAAAKPRAAKPAVAKPGAARTTGAKAASAQETSAKPTGTQRPAARRPRRTAARRPAALVAHCPYCALILEPAPATSCRCERCRQRIVVKRVDGSSVYLTEAAVAVFDAERRRLASAARLIRERTRWLAAATTVGAPAERIDRLADARLTEDSVGAARTLYVRAADRAFRAARHDRDWDRAARLRRDQALLLYRATGTRTPPVAEIVTLFREGVAAELRGIAEISRDAELVAASCCDTCRADDRLIARISTELRRPRLPHAGCPRGLCRCHWDLAARDRSTMRRYLRRRPTSETRQVADEAPTPT